MRRNPVGKDVQQETPDEFPGAQGHRFDLIASAIIFPFEPDLIVFDIEQAVIRDGDAVAPQKVLHEAANSRQSTVPRYGRVFAFGFNVLQERQHGFRLDIVEIQVG